MHKIIGVEGPPSGKEHILESNCLIGRDPACQIYISDLTTSRTHARIFITDQGCVLQDLGSINGTYINNSQIKKHILSDGDEIRIGSYVYRYQDYRPKKNKWVNMVTVINDRNKIFEDLSEEDTEPKVQSESLENIQDLQADLQSAKRRLNAYQTLINATSATLDTDTLFHKILDSLFNVFSEADRGFIMLLDQNDQLIAKAIRKRQGTGFEGELIISQTVVTRVLSESKSILSTTKSDIHLVPVSKMCAPLLSSGKPIGILHIEGRKGGRLEVRSKETGEKLAKIVLSAAPVYDGMAAAGTRLYVSLSNGQLACFSRKP